LVVESPRFRLSVDRPSGNQTLFDKVLNRQVAGPLNLSAEEERLDKNWFRDETTGRTFPNLVEQVEVVENGCVRARISIEGRIGNVRTRQEWLLYRDAGYVDLVDTLIWEGPSPLVRVQRVMATGIAAPEVVYGVAFGANTWQNHQPNIEPKFADEIGADSWQRIREVQNWIDLGDADYGLTVASDHRAVELDAGTLRINLIRSGGWRDAFDTVPYGSNRFSIRTRLLPHQGDWKESAAYRAGWALNLPLTTITVNDPLSPKRLEPVASLCQSPARNVLITTIKRAEDATGTVVRGYEAEGGRATGSPVLAGEVSKISEVSLLEEQPRPVGEVVWQPNEIKTLKLE
jgi:alpha-mannosidase